MKGAALDEPFSLIGSFQTNCMDCINSVSDLYASHTVYLIFKFSLCGEEMKHHLEFGQITASSIKPTLSASEN